MTSQDNASATSPMGKNLVPIELDAEVPQSQYWCFKEKNFLSLPDIETQITNPVAYLLHQLCYPSCRLTRGKIKCYWIQMYTK